jgi:hypothetical protein
MSRPPRQKYQLLVTKRLRQWDCVHRVLALHTCLTIGDKKKKKKKKEKRTQESVNSQPINTNRKEKEKNRKKHCKRITPLTL